MRVVHPGARLSLRSTLLANLDSAREWCRQLAWARGATQVARSLAHQNRYHAIIVSSPPHPTQLVGATLSREFALPYIPDYRDPWIFGEPRTRVTSWLDGWLGQRFERRCLKQARMVICNTERAKRTIERIEEYRSLEVTCISNGYDPIDDIRKPDPRRFRIVFAGWLYPSMDVRPLMAACARLRARFGLPDDRVRLEFIGTGDTFGGVPLASLASAYGLNGCFVLRPRSSREEARRHQQAAAVSVIFDNPASCLAIPTKFYDTAQMLGSVLILGNQDTALNDAARRIAVEMQDPNNQSALDQTLDRAFARWQKRDFSHPADKLGVFDRRHQTQQLHQLLSTLNGDR